jgi:predicted nucleotidyltransferase
MRNIVKIKVGSHLYGTETENSDLDYRSIFIPYRKDIIIQRVPKFVKSKKNKKDGEKNIPGEYDEESYSLHYYLKLLLEGQTVALDMLFAPKCFVENFYVNFWVDIRENKSRFISNKTLPFVGYCSQQSIKYGIKGRRLSEIRNALDALKQYNDNDLVKDIVNKCKDFKELTNIFFLNASEYVYMDCKRQDNGNYFTFLNICGKSFPSTVKIKYVRECLQNFIKKYDERALMSEKNEGVDWKALSHAVRISNQAIELFSTGNITFPLINREHILDIKLGKIPYKEVVSEIEDLLLKVEEKSNKSVLPKEPDYKFSEDLIEYYYGRECNRIYGATFR